MSKEHDLAGAELSDSAGQRNAYSQKIRKKMKATRLSWKVGDRNCAKDPSTSKVSG